ncbi:PKD domain-containing protein [Luteolibacter sp. SL250]|uniref:PKD domain-containing protein n=1 Tax=Luteolibacter sp. SL250 TaxID=2995170 RepID=UPI00226EF3CB|nr:PKD domain-containing protein [Luteolibacter sp. SL250]WAC18457.1 PKD domain-containing protein [Luteolibacter sp. SL250]
MQRFRAFLLPILLLFVVALVVILIPDREHPSTNTPARPAPREVISTEILSNKELAEWTNPQRAKKSPSAAELPRLLELAKERSATMKRLISAEPRQALEAAITPAAHAALPEELKPFYERPFSQTATLRVLPVCAPGVNMEPERTLEMDGRTWNASVYGWRKGQMSKQGSPLAGITLDGLAAISDGFFQIVPRDEEAFASALPMGNFHPDRDFSTGEALGGNPILTVMDGKQYRFSNAASLEETNRQLIALEMLPAPKAGASVVFAAPAPAAGGGIDWAAAKEEVRIQASTWTETAKDVFCIRVDFPNLVGAPSSQSELANLMNGSVASSILEMSYGKTTINATVSSATIRLPQPTTFYLPGKNNELHADALTAYKAANGATSLDGYDIVVVHFASIGMQGGGITYGGLADINASRQWLQGTLHSSVAIHEFGHNYGIGHASFWQTSNGSVTGTGTSVEYGDHTDIMGEGPVPEGHFHMQAKQFLNWFPTTNDNWLDATATGSGTRRIYRFDSASTTGALRGVRVTKGTSPSAEYYWVGYRPGIPTLPAFQNGAYVIWQKPAETRSWLIDTTPNSAAGKNDSAVAIGRTYSDTTANVHITPTAKGGSGADQWMDVNVQIGPFPTNTAPTATLTAPPTAVTRVSSSFSVAALDANLDTLAYSWDFGDGAVSQNSPSVTHQWITSGTYNVTVTVSDMKGGTVTRTQSVTVTDPLDTWTTRTSGTTANLRDVAAGGGSVITIGYEGAPIYKGVYSKSNDGVTWTRGEIKYNTNPVAIIHDGTRFIVAAEEWDPPAQVWRGAIFTSTDGTSWTRRHFGGPELTAVAAGGGAYVAVGNNGTALYSADSVTWTPVTSGTTMNFKDVAWGGGRFVAGAGNIYYPGPYVRAVLSSTNGQTWVNNDTAGLPYLTEITEVEYINGRFIAGGWNVGIRKSTDLGVTFSAVEGSLKDIAGLAHGNGTYLAVGIDLEVDLDPGEGVVRPDVNMVSADGESWISLSTEAQNDRNDLIFFNNTFITVGNGGTIRQSGIVAPALTGFAAWTQTHFPDAPPLSGPNDDFDGDGVKNLAEYAMGTLPKDATSRANITAVKQGATMILTIPRDPTVTGVTITGTTSTTLGSSTWTSTGVTVLEDSASQFRASIPVGAGKAFLRAEFSAP